MKKEKRKGKPGYFATYRHFRRDSGAVTAACIVHPLGDGTFDIVAGFSFCNPDDHFSRPEGRKYATERLMKNPIIIKAAKGIAPALMEYLRKTNASMFVDELFKDFGIADYKHANKDKAGNFDNWFMQFVREL